MSDIDIFAIPQIDGPVVHIVVAEVGDRKISLRAFYDSKAAHAFKLLAARSIRDYAAYIHEHDIRRGGRVFRDLVSAAMTDGKFKWDLPLKTMEFLLGFAGMQARCGVYVLPFDGRELGEKQLKRIENAFGYPSMTEEPF
jgi:hypothetical protein